MVSAVMSQAALAQRQGAALRPSQPGRQQLVSGRAMRRVQRRMSAQASLAVVEEMLKGEIKDKTAETAINGAGRRQQRQGVRGRGSWRIVQLGAGRGPPRPGSPGTPPTHLGWVPHPHRLPPPPPAPRSHPLPGD